MNPVHSLADRRCSLLTTVSSVISCTLALLAGNLLAEESPAIAAPGRVPDAIRQQFALAPFYQKYVNVGGLPIVGSDKVSDDALSECAWIVNQMLGKRPDILKALEKTGVRFAVMAHNEYTTDIPEHATLQPKVYWDRRARGLGATKARPAVSCAEENLLAFPGDPYQTENIGIHEFAHAIHEMGLREVDPSFDNELKQTFERAINAGLWKGTYAAVNRQEYWAEAVQCWFDNNRENDALHNHVNTRTELKEYDPRVASLCDRVFGDIPWRYQKPAARPESGRAHLHSFDPANAPHFQWRDVPVPEQPRVSLQCAEGEIEFELASTVAREQSTAFLNAVHQGYYSDGQLHCSTSLVRLKPAVKLPSGEPVPAGQGVYEIALNDGEPSPAQSSGERLRAKVTKGGVVLRKLSGATDSTTSSRAVPIQRIVRLN